MHVPQVHELKAGSILTPTPPPPKKKPKVVRLRCNISFKNVRQRYQILEFHLSELLLKFKLMFSIKTIKKVKLAGRGLPKMKAKVKI